MYNKVYTAPALSVAVRVPIQGTTQPSHAVFYLSPGVLREKVFSFPPRPRSSVQWTHGLFGYPPVSRGLGTDVE